MKKILLLSILFLGIQYLGAQNLVLNPSFENSSSCPLGPGQFPLADNWDDVNAGVDSCSSPDLIAGCSWQMGGVNSPNMLIGYQNSRTGSQHAGLILYEAFPLLSVCIPDDYREYIGGELSAPMQAGQTYCVSFYVSKADQAQWATDKFGVYLSNTAVNYNFPCPGGGVLPFTPQLTYSGPAITDTADWVLLQWDYTAVGGEQFITIGNFETTANTEASIVGTCGFAIHPYAYYFIDDVSVTMGSCCDLTASATITDASCNGAADGAIDLTASSSFTCSSNSVVINEIMANPSGANDGVDPNTAEYIELIGPPGTDIGCYVLTDGDWSITIPAGTTIPADGIFTIGNDAVYGAGTFDLDAENCGCFVEGATGDALLIFTNGGEYLALHDASGTMIDGLIYGAPTAGNTPPNGGSTTGGVIATAGLAGCLASVTIPAAASFSTTALSANDGESFVRNPDGAGGNWTTQAGGSVNACNFPSAISYTWSNGATTEDISGLAAGVYSVTIDDGFCQIVNTYTITEPSAISVTAVVTDESCGAGTGAIDLTVSGGTSAYTYLWSDGSTSEDLTGLSAGTYDVTITDAVGCTTTATGTVNAGSSVTITTSSVDPSCNGATDGCAIVTATGTGPFTYLWSDGSTTDTICGLAAGTYDVTITEGGSVTGTDTLYQEGFEGTHNWTLNVSTGANGADNNFWVVNDNEGGVLPPGCGTGGNGDKTLHITSVFNPNGGAAYDAGGLCGFLFCPQTNMRAESPVFSTVGYTGITLEFDYISNGDGLNDNASVYYNDGTGWQVLDPSIKSTVCGSGQGQWTAFSATLPASCDNNPNVQVAINWTNNDDGIGSDPSVAINNILLTSTSTGGATCSTTASVTLNEPTALTASTTVTDESCGQADGAIDLTVGGGTTAYTYSWSNTATTEDLSNLTAGTYDVTVTDANGCTVSTSAMVNGSSAITATITVTDASCGANDGAIDLTVTGGSPTYNFIWSTGATTEDLSGLAAGNYDVTVTDASGCSTTLTAAVNSTGTLAAAVVVTDETCGQANGAIDLTPSGGTSPYTFIWSTGATTEDLSALSAGSYDVTVTDNNGCVALQSAVISSVGGATVTVNSVTNVSCNGEATGAIDIDATAANLTCSSSSVVINEIMANPSDANDGVDPNTSEYIELIGPPGTNIGCYVLTDGDWTITIPAGTTIPADGIFTIGNDVVYGAGTFDLDAENCACFTDGGGGSGLLIFTNGGEYLAMFDPTGTMVDGFIYGSPSAGNMPPNGGSTTAGVINTIGLAGCLSSVTIPAAASFLNLGLAAGNGDAFVRNPDGAGGAWTTQTGGSVNACNFSAAATLSYIWSTGDTTEDVSGLTAGIYTVTVTDGNGCSTVESFTITEPSAITVTNNSIVDETCTTLGSIDVSASGGTGPYTYLWDDPSSQTTAVATALVAGNYNVTVTDDNGCEMPAGPFIVNSFGVPSINLDSVTNVICAGGSSGALDISLTGGVAPYTYSWSNGQSTEDISGLAVGTYSVTVTDDNNCTVTTTATITEPSPISIGVLIGNATCVGNDGVIDATVSGGVGPYSYQWDNGQTTQDLNNLPNADYELTVTDANGCSTTYGAPITVALDTTISLSATITDLDCSGDSIGAVSLTINNSAPAYTYLWSTGDTSASLTALGAGNYDVTVTDASGCSATASATINTPVVPTLSAYIGQVGVVNDTIDLGDEISLNAGNDQTADGVTYSWTANPTNVDFSAATSPVTNATPEGTGDYSFMVIASSPDACADTSMLTVYVNELLDPVVPSAFTPNGDDVNETFYVINLDIEHLIEFKVFNRWGTLVYDDASEGVWDGTFNGVEQPADAYIYLISYQRPQDAEPVVLRGQITLLR